VALKEPNVSGRGSSRELRSAGANFIAAKLIYGNTSHFTEPAAGANETYGSLPNPSFDFLSSEFPIGSLLKLRMRQ
jgi:hypothetical protein